MAYFSLFNKESRIGKSLRIDEAIFIDIGWTSCAGSRAICRPCTLQPSSSP